MSDYTVLDLKSELTGMGHGLSLNKVNSPKSTINRSARDLLVEYDFFELREERQIANSIFDNVYDYPAPSDLKMDKVIDVFPQVNRENEDVLNRNLSRQFDRKKTLTKDIFSVEYRNGTKLLRVSKNYVKAKQQPTLLGDMSSLTNNGTWTAGGDAENLSIDNVNYVSGTGSINFDLNGAGTSWFVEADDIDTIDLTGKNDGSIFNFVYLPDSSKHTNITIRWGSSSSDYWETTVTNQFFGSFEDGWNQQGVDWSSATTVGSPDESSITYVRVGGVYNGDEISNMRIDAITSILGSKFLVSYYSDSIFYDAITREKKVKADSDSDIIRLESSGGLNGLVYLTAMNMAQEVQNQGGSIDVEFFLGKYNTWRQKYGTGYRSEKKDPVDTYWDARRKRRSRL